MEGEEASVELLGVSVKECGDRGLFVIHGASAKATQCEFCANREDGVSLFRGSKGIFTDCFHNNGDTGVYADKEDTLVELRGEKTEIHHNGEDGLAAGHWTTLNIHIPSRSITALVHDNKDRDLFTWSNGKIQSQLSSSSLELTVIHVALLNDNEDEEDN